MTHDDASTGDPATPLDAAEQDPTVEENLGAGPATTERGEDTGSEQDVPEAPAGPGATPADPDQPLNPA
jgi:hypothetical protein